MSMRPLLRTAAFTVGVLIIAAPASAQIVQSVHAGIGVFYPRGFDSRVADDTLVANLTAAEPLQFDITRFQSAVYFGEWNIDVGSHISFGAGLGYYSDSIPSVYRNLVNDDGSEITQDLSLRMVPITGIVRFLPFGSPMTFQPYVGGGVSIIPWRYIESGQFVDTADNSVFTDRFTSSGTAVAPLFALGARIPVGGDIYGLTVEWRYQFGTGNTGGLTNGFLGEKIDLSGGMLNFGFLVRF
jgi:hypothetical protein